MNDITKIKIKSLYKSFNSHEVLRGIDLDVMQGSSVVILGGSGTGKSVLIKIIIGLIEPDSGSITIDGEETVGISAKERFEILKNCGFLFQGGALFDSLTIKENITFFPEKIKPLTEKDKIELAISKLQAVRLPERVLHLYPAELSGGMQKRAALARAIAADPQIIFFDEPTTGLDPVTANVINDLIIEVRTALKATTITITHDIFSAERIAEKLSLIHDGHIIWSGTKEEMRDSDNPYLHQFINGNTTGPITA